MDINILHADGSAEGLTGLTRRNLLDNSDFQNPINQRGLTSTGSGWGYLCDRWISGGDTSKLTAIADGYISIAPGRYLVQALPDKGRYTGKNLTLAFGRRTSAQLVANPWIASGIYSGDGAAGKISSVSGEVTVEVYSVADNDCLYAKVLNNSAYNIWVTWAALYEGVYTADTLPPYQYKGYAAEMAECQRYYRRVAKDPRVAYQGFCFSDTQARITLSGGGAMRIVPTVTPLEDFTTAFAYLYQSSSAIIPSTIGGVGNVTEVTVSLNATGLTPKAPCVWRPNCAIDISAEL